MKNYYVAQGDAIAIKVSQRNKNVHWILIDTKDLEIMPKGTICVRKDHSGYYAMYRNGRKMEQLHRLIMGFPERLEIDHRNHDTLDDRRDNLSTVTNQVNHFNQHRKGYRWHKAAKKWEAHIGLNRKLIHLGYFKNEADAEYQYLLAKEIIHND